MSGSWSLVVRPRSCTLGVLRGPHLHHAHRAAPSVSRPQPSPQADQAQEEELPRPAPNRAPAQPPTPRARRWSAYMQLVAASLCSMVKDNGIHKYLTLVKEVQVGARGVRCRRAAVCGGGRGLGGGARRAWGFGTLRWMLCCFGPPRAAPACGGLPRRDGWLLVSMGGILVIKQGSTHGHWAAPPPTPCAGTRRSSLTWTRWCTCW